MEYKVVMGIEQTIFYDDIEETNQAFYHYPFIIEQSWLTLLSQQIMKILKPLWTKF